MHMNLRLKAFERLRDATLPLIEHYHDDLLVHDRKIILENEGTFLHWTHRSGTHMIAMITPESYPPYGMFVDYIFGHADRERMLEDGRILVKYLINYRPAHTCHHINRFGVVEQVFDDEAYALWDDYEKAVRAAWSSPNYRSTYREEVTCGS